jgi:hypothetical protein
MTEQSLVPQFKKLSDYQDRLPGHRANRRLHLSTLIRWCAVGVRLRDGSRLRLRAVRAGQRWVTTDEWLAEFLERTTTAATPAATVPPPSAAKRDRAIEAAGRRLSEMGA